MKTLFLQMLKKNRRDYSLVLICGMVIVSIVYFSCALAGCMNQITTGSAGDFTKIYGSLGIFIVSFVLLFFLMWLVILDYIRKRSYTYALLTVLGIKKKHKYAFIGAEYAGIVLISITGGLLLGVVEAEVLKKFLYYIFADFTGTFDYGNIPVKLTIIIAVVGYVLLFVICDELIACLGMDSLINFGQRQGRTFHKSPVLASIGSVLLFAGCVLQFTYWGKISKLFPSILASFGLLLFMISVIAMVLLNFRKRTKKYYKNILWLNNWYHRYSYNVNMSFVMAVFLFITIYMFGMKVLDNYPVTAEQEFRYDLVWMANQGDEPFLGKLADDYGVEIYTQKCIRVTTPDFGEHMGISASEYEKWTGEHIELAEDEIYVIYQRDKEEKSELGIDYGAPYPRLHIGKANRTLWVDTGSAGIIPASEFKKYHRVKGEKTQVLTGVFESSSLEEYYGKVWEAIIVFSDEYYEKVKDTADGANLAVMMNIPEKYDEVVAEVHAYAKDNSQTDWLDEKGKNLFKSFLTVEYQKGRNLVYESEVLQKQAEKGKIFDIVSNTINFFVMAVCILFTLYIKQRCDFSDLEWKYTFYNHSGMNRRKRKKYVRKEICLTGMLSLTAGIILSMIYVSINVFVKRPMFAEGMIYVAGVGGMCAGFVVIISVFESAFAIKNFLQIERRSKNG